MSREEMGLRRVTTRSERFSYAGYFWGQNFILIIILQYLMVFYTDVVGLTPAAAGLLFLIARVWDALNDPIMGIIVDRMDFKRGGKFKPWINGVIFLLPLITIFLFQNPAASLRGKLIWAYISYLLWGMIYTVSDIPIFALATVMTRNPDERVSIISIGRLGAGIGSLIGVIIITPLSMTLGWSKGIVIVAVIALIAMLPVKYKTVERVTYRRDPHHSLSAMFRDLIKNRYLIIVYLVIIISHLSNSSSSTIVYFVKYNLGNEILVPVLSLAAASSAIVFPLFLPALIGHSGKRSVFLSLMMISILSSLLFYFIGYGNLTLVFIFIFLKYIALNLPYLMMAMFTTDCLEYGYSLNGVRNEGMVFSIQTFSIKIVLALQGVVGAFLLSRSGYIANSEQSRETLDEIWRMTTLYPMGGQILAVLVFYLFYTLTEEKVAVLIHRQSEEPGGSIV